MTEETGTTTPETTEEATATCGAATKDGSPCENEAGWGTDHVGEGRCKFHAGQRQVEEADEDVKPSAATSDHTTVESHEFERAIPLEGKQEKQALLGVLFDMVDGDLDAEFVVPLGLTKRARFDAQFRQKGDGTLAFRIIELNR